MQEITLIRPDDWHLHLRDASFLFTTVPFTAARFARAVIMPNLVPPVTSAKMALAYRERIMHHVPNHQLFTPLMTLYLTDNTTPEMIREAKRAGVIAVKLYPAGATTNSASGVTDLTKVTAALETMAECGMPLLIHGEVTHADCDIFDREARFIEQVLSSLVHKFPQLSIVLEHITTKDAVDFVLASNGRLGATITVHHLLYNRNQLLAGGIKPHYYCLPILKHQRHQQALIEAATSGHEKFFLGTDSAPHAKHQKESSCGCAGIFSAHAAIELYAEVFDEHNALNKLEAFASLNGPNFYGLPVNTDTITLRRQSWTVPEAYPYGEEQLIPLAAGEIIKWQLLESEDAYV